MVSVVYNQDVVGLLEVPHAPELRNVGYSSRWNRNIDLSIECRTYLCTFLTQACYKAQILWANNFFYNFGNRVTLIFEDRDRAWRSSDRTKS